MDATPAFFCGVILTCSVAISDAIREKAGEVKGQVLLEFCQSSWERSGLG